MLLTNLLIKLKLIFLEKNWTALTVIDPPFYVFLMLLFHKKIILKNEIHLFKNYFAWVHPHAPNWIESATQQIT